MHILDGKTVLVTGATGLIGSNLCYELLNKSTAKVIALSRSKDKLERVFGEYLSDPNFTYVSRDICEPLNISERIDCIFHAASPISGAVISEQPVNVILPNIEGIKNCLDFIKDQEQKHGIKGRIIVFSSATVYSDAAMSDRTVSEDDTESRSKINAPNAPYAESKRMSEVIANAYCKQYGVDAVIARIGYVYGYCKELPNTAFYSFMKTALAGQDITINNPSMARRDNIYIDDVISGLFTVYEQGTSGEAYNVSSAGEKYNFAAADEMACVIADIVNKEKLSEKPVSVKYLSEADSRQSGIILSNDKLKSLGWAPKYSLYDGIEKTIKLYLRK